MTFSETKSLNSVLYISENLKRKDFHKIFKILYFADRNHFSDYGRPITGDIYVAMVDGPVPSNIYDIFKAVRGDSYFANSNPKLNELFKVHDKNFITPLVAANLDSLSKTDKEYLDKSISEYGEMTWEEIREKSHDYAWNNTVPNNTISFEDMLLEAGNEPEYIEYVKEQYAF